MLSILNELEQNSKRTDKERILQESRAVPFFQQFLTYALNPYKVFYLKRFEKHTPVSEKYNHRSPEFWALLDNLEERKITGNAALEAHKQLCLNMSEDDQEILRRILIKDIRCGVKSATVNKVFPGLVPEFKVMAAHGFNEIRVTFPVYVEPKIDGIRALAFINGPKAEDVVFLSRSGKEFDSLDAIAEAIVKVFPVGWVIDGEMKVAGSFQESSSAIMRSVNLKDDAKIYYSVFDAMPRENFDRRDYSTGYAQRRQWFKDKIDAAKEELIFYWTAYQCKNMEEIETAYKEFRDLGHEGAMVKKHDGRYEFKRSHNWLKMKPEETVDLEITGFVEGRGKHAGRLGALLVDYNGKECSVGGGFTDELREEIWNNKAKYLGAIAEFSFTEETDDGVMRHNRFERMRTFKGEKA